MKFACTGGAAAFALNFLRLLGSTTPITAQVAEPNFKVSVTTPDELEDALRREVTHIIVTEHMDLAAWTVSNSIENEAGQDGDNRPAFSAPNRQLLTAGTQSIQGECSTPVEDFIPAGFPAVISSRTGQCALLVRGSFLAARTSNVWLHNLYFRSTALALPVDADYGTPFGILAVSHGQLFLTSVTFQGELTPSNATASVEDINLLARNTMPVSMGERDDSDDLPPAEVLMINCIVNAFNSPQAVQYGSLAIVRSAYSEMFAPVVSIIGPNGAVSIFNSSFIRVTTALEADEPEISIVTDPLPTNQLYGDSNAANDILDGVKPFETAPTGLFLVDRDPSLLDLQRSSRNAIVTQLTDVPDAQARTDEATLAPVRYRPETAAAAARHPLGSAAALLAAGCLVVMAAA